DAVSVTGGAGPGHGGGGCDMKGCFPRTIEALRPLRDQPLKQPLIILATADEESAMGGAQALVADDLLGARHAVIGEPTALQPIRIHKRILMERVDIIGEAGHSSDPSLGRNAIEAMHQVISELLELRRSWQAQWHNPLFSVPTPTLNLGCIHGGDNPNRICGRCALEFDLRPLPGMEPEALRAA